MAESFAQEREVSEALDRSLPRTGFTLAILTLLFVALFAFLAIYPQSPPPAASADAPPTDFSSGRAIRYIQAISQKPHPIGSAEHAKVREYILGELTALGLDAEVQSTDIVTRRPFVPRLNGGTVHNIVARLKGTGGGGKAILLMGHYDSAPTSLGASDDGSAVAVMLESLRALKAGAPLKNDLILLFTDGEEVGLLGAKAFVSEHPWAKDVGVVLNFEARGTNGPALMFETSNANGWLINQFAQAAPKPVTTSLFYEVYRLLPNDTDLSIFKEAGYSGLNFAYTGGYPHYHTLSDSVENIDQRSLQHQGSYCLALTRHFGNLDLNATTGRNAVYFNTLGSAFIYYSAAWVIPLSILVLLLFAAVLIIGFRKKLLTVSGIVLGFFALLAMMLSAAVVVTLVLMVVRAVHSGYRLIAQGSTYNNGLYIISFLALTIAVASILYFWFRQKIKWTNLLVGGMCWWVILMCLTSFYLPGASYLFTWPLLFTLVALGVMFISQDPQTVTTRHMALFYVCAVPGIVLCAPIIYLLSMGLATGMFRAVIVLIVMQLALLIPLLNVVLAPNRWLLPAAAALCGAIFIAAGSYTAGFDKNNPKPTNLFYALNADSGKAIWASFERQPDEWTQQFFPAGAEKSAITEYIPLRFSGFLNSEAPAVALEAPHIALLDKRMENGVKTLRLQVTSPRRAPLISVVIESDTEITGAEINGKRVAEKSSKGPTLKMPPGVPKNRWEVAYYAPSDDGIKISFATKTSQPITIRVVDQSYGLPDSLAQSWQARPDYMMPTPYPFTPYTDTTLVSKSFSF